MCCLPVQETVPKFKKLKFSEFNFEVRRASVHAVFHWYTDGNPGLIPGRGKIFLSSPQHLALL